MNDYLGKLLHEARYRDLLKEAEGGRRRKAARAGRMALLPGAAGPGLLATLGGALVLSLLFALVVTATVTAFGGA